MVEILVIREPFEQNTVCFALECVLMIVLMDSYKDSY